MRRNKQTEGERIVKDIKRKTRKQYSAEEKGFVTLMPAFRHYADIKIITERI